MKRQCKKESSTFFFNEGESVRERDNQWGSFIDRSVPEVILVSGLWTCGSCLQEEGVQPGVEDVGRKDVQTKTAR